MEWRQERQERQEKVMNVRLPANSVISADSLYSSQSRLMQNYAPGYNQGLEERLRNISTLG